MSERANFQDFVNKVFWALLVAAVAYGAHQISSATDAVAKLNTSVEIIISRAVSRDDLDRIRDAQMQSFAARMNSYERAGLERRPR